MAIEFLLSEDRLLMAAIEAFGEMALLNPKGGLDYAVDEDICGGDVLGYLTEANVIDILAELKRRHKHVRTITHMFNTVILRDEESD